MSTSPVIDKIMVLVAPIVTDLELDLYDLEYNGGIVKITVDTPPGSDGGVTLDQLALVTRLVGRDFDHHDPIAGRYTLEVSSPGLERTLRTPAHFRREIGKVVNIRLRANVDGARRIQGVLVGADDTTATVRTEGVGDADAIERVVAIDTIDRAKTVFRWERGEDARRPASSTTAPNQTIGKPSVAKLPGTTKRTAPNSPKKSKSPKKSRVAAGGVKAPPGPSDELDSPIEEEETA